MIASLKLLSLADFFFVQSEMCTDDRGQNDQNNQATAAALRARSKKSDLDLLRENEEKFRFCGSEKNMDKLLDDLPPFTYNTIVKYARNTGKNIQHSLVSSNFHKPLPKYKSY